MALTSVQIDLMARFVSSLTEYYRATEIKHEKHRCFTNPWNMGGGDPAYIWILRESGWVKFGHSVTRSMRMSDKMILSIACRGQRLPATVVQAAEVAIRER